MFTHRSYYMYLVIAMVVVTACVPQAAVTTKPASPPTATLAQIEPVTLRLAVADAEERPSTPYVLEFIEQVNTRSNGNITVEPIWDAGADTEPVFEQGVAKVVAEGQYDLGLTASRAFDHMGIASFQALQAPFLITDDALAEAVASSDIGTRMLENLSSAGPVGLALWPEDLRHPFSVVPGKHILSPADFEGATVRVIPSEISHLLIETFGGSPTFGDEEYQVAESGLRNGFSLTGRPITTGNVIFFPKYQVLFANGAALGKLSEAQRSILREAAAAAQQKAIAEHTTEAEAATAWCADGGTVVMASAEQVAAFEAAAQPVFEKIEQTPFNAELIAAIRELKAKTQPAPGAEACESGLALPDAQPTQESDQAWSKGLPPNGTWQAERTVDHFLSTGMMRSAAESGYAGVYTITFQDGKYKMVYVGLRERGVCLADYELVEEDIVRLTYDPNSCSNPPEDFQWRIDGEGLHLHHVASFSGGQPEVEWTPFYEATPWQKLEEWSTGLPPNGTWQAEVTVDDFVRMGVFSSVAEREWAGVYTLTFEDGKFIEIKEGLDGTIYRCDAEYELVEEDVLRLTITSDPNDCSRPPEDIQWRIDDEGLLHLHLVATADHFVEMTAQYESKPWQQVDNP